LRQVTRSIIKEKTFIAEGFSQELVILLMAIPEWFIWFHRTGSVSEVWILGFFNSTKMRFFSKTGYRPVWESAVDILRRPI